MWRTNLVTHQRPRGAAAGANVPTEPGAGASGEQVYVEDSDDERDPEDRVGEPGPTQGASRAKVSRVAEALRKLAEAAEEKADDSPATETLETPAPADATESGPAPAPSPQPTTSEPSPALKAMQEELIGEFDYDPTKNHQVNLEKTALYARPARQ